MTDDIDIIHVNSSDDVIIGGDDVIIGGETSGSICMPNNEPWKLRNAEGSADIKTRLDSYLNDDGTIKPKDLGGIDFAVSEDYSYVNGWRVPKKGQKEYTPVQERAIKEMKEALGKYDGVTLDNIGINYHTGAVTCTLSIALPKPATNNDYIAGKYYQDKKLTGLEDDDHIQYCQNVSSSGMACSKCNELNEYASANQDDGTYICYKCRSEY